MTTVETREPDWSDHHSSEVVRAECEVVESLGSYADYLEARIPPFVRSRPHWCAKGLTTVELDPLRRMANLESAFAVALFSPPECSALLYQMQPELRSTLTALNDNRLRSNAEVWAGTMSTPEHTHSVTGTRVADGWSTGTALDILQQIAALARRAIKEQELYVLVEC